MFAGRRVTFSLITLLFLSSPGWSHDRAAARRAYLRAHDYYQHLMGLKKAERAPKEYRRAIFLFRRVIDHDPTYGACDDALFYMAGLFDELHRRFGSDSDRRRAIYYYEFVAQEYPATRFRQKSLSRAQQLRNDSRPVAKTEKASVEQKPEATLNEVRYWSNEDYTRVVLQLDKEVEFTKSVLSNPDRIYFDLQDTGLEPDMQDRSYSVNGLNITRIRVGQNQPTVARVVLDFDQIRKHTVFALYDPFRIVIDTRGVQHSEKASDGTDSAREMKTAEATIPFESKSSHTTSEEAIGRPASPTAQGDLTMTRVLGLKVGRVVIDPGHGGNDTGTVGPTGLLEKELVLDIARRLKELLEQRLGNDVDVILTRDSDRFVPLEERTAIANKNGADLFLSIHANASHNQRVSGVETYVLSFATSQAEREVASRENASSQRTIRELEDLLKQIALEDYNQESRDLAQVVQASLHSELQKYRKGQRNRGVKQAPFIVLIGSNMPSILTEVGFISNPADERFFKGGDARGRVAEALFSGVTRYFESLGSSTVAARNEGAGSP